MMFEDLFKSSALSKVIFRARMYQVQYIINLLRNIMILKNCFCCWCMIFEVIHCECFSVFLLWMIS